MTEREREKASREQRNFQNAWEQKGKEQEARKSQHTKPNADNFYFIFFLPILLMFVISVVLVKTTDSEGIEHFTYYTYTYTGHKMDPQYFTITIICAENWWCWLWTMSELNWIELNSQKSKNYSVHIHHTPDEKRDTGHILIKRGCKRQPPFNNNNIITKVRPEIEKPVQLSWEYFTRNQNKRKKKLWMAKSKHCSLFTIHHIASKPLQMELMEILTRQKMSKKNKRINSMARNVNGTYSTIWALPVNIEH